MTTFLNTIKNSVHLRAEAIQLTADVPLNTLDFCDAFNVQTIPAIIAEIKFASPSRGRIYHGALDALAIAGEYLAHGASALSILTEPEYFQGNIASIRAVRRAFPTAHILLKDFILSELQVAQALACGANAVLLIVAFLTEQRLRLLYEYALTLGLTPLIEVHDADELKKALALNPRMIGINHRNLNTLEIDLECSTSLIRMIPEGVYCVAESGIERKSHLDMMATRGFNGCLIGSSFMQHDHPGHALQHMISGDDDAG